MNSKPPLTDQSAGPDGQPQADAPTQRLMDASAVEAENLNREAGQRFWLRNLAVAVTLGAIGLMTLALYHGNRLFDQHGFMEASSVYVVALLITPILAITTLTVALLIAAFRGYKDANGKEAARAATEAARSGGSFG